VGACPPCLKTLFQYTGSVFLHFFIYISCIPTPSPLKSSEQYGNSYNNNNNNNNNNKNKDMRFRTATTCGGRDRRVVDIRLLGGRASLRFEAKENGVSRQMCIDLVTPTRPF